MGAIISLPGARGLSETTPSSTPVVTLPGVVVTSAPEETLAGGQSGSQSSGLRRSCSKKRSACSSVGVDHGGCDEAPRTLCQLTHFSSCRSPPTTCRLYPSFGHRSLFLP